MLLWSKELMDRLEGERPPEDCMDDIVANLMQRIDYLATMLAAHDGCRIGEERAAKREVWKDAAVNAVREGWTPAEGE